MENNSALSDTQTALLKAYARTKALKMLAEAGVFNAGEPQKPQMLEVLYFGWSPSIGHGLYFRPVNGTLVGPRTPLLYESTPWGMKLDGGLCPESQKFPIADLAFTHEYMKVHRLGGWTAVAFWDRSGDKRPGSNTAFLVRDQTTSVEDVLKWARIQWPEVWARPGFPIR